LAQVKRGVFHCFIYLSILCGCERHKNPSVPTPQANAKTNPSNIATTEPVAQPSSIILIDDQPYQFPPAKIILKNKDQQLAAILFSDDPPSAIKDNYSGNSFYLEATPQLADDGTLNGAVWDYKAQSSDRVDTVSGIYLRGRKQHLQPFEVHITFGSSNSPVPISLAGTFILYDSENDQAPGKFVTVRAEFSAEIKVRSPSK
jgi:hypothetical protein